MEMGDRSAWASPASWVPACPNLKKPGRPSPLSFPTKFAARSGGPIVCRRT